MTPAADTRGWVSLPAQVVMASGSIEPAAVTFTVDGTSRTTTFVARGAKCSLVWGRTEPSSNSQLSAPIITEGKHEVANSQMRTQLESTFADTTKTASTNP